MLIFFWRFLLFVKNILVLWKLTYETMSYVGDSAQEGQGFIDSLTGVYSLLAAE